MRRRWRAARPLHRRLTSACLEVYAVKNKLTVDDGRDQPARGSRRRTLRLFAAITLSPLLALPLRARAADPPANLSFRALRNGVPIGVHTVSFRQDGERLVVTTRVDISVKV